MIRLAIAGACGKMGVRLIELARDDERFEVVAALEADGHPKLGSDVAGAAGLRVTDRSDAEFDVLVEFSRPAGTMQWIDRCLDAGAGIVIGTTGHTDDQLAVIGNAAETIPVFKAPNMSVGVNVLFRLVGQVARALGDGYDIEIVESHHRHKTDAPSGTAYGLLDSVLDATGRSRDVVVHGREGRDLDRPAKQIGMHALRVGDTVGEHAVYFAAMGETVIVKHEAHTRDTFAQGALRAAQWLIAKPAGTYSMQDVLFG